jgi:Cft2 family RNA processing exonuclease
MEFIALGDTDDIGASCHYLGLDGTGLVLDAGSDPEREGRDGVPRFEHVHNHPDRYVDHALITHAHHDHIGSIPLLFQEFPHVLTHMTEATRMLIEFLLPSSARLQRRRLRSGETDADPLFSEDELELYKHLYLTHDLETPFDVTGVRGEARVSAKFYTAGHILGSVGVELIVERDAGERRIFYTSDTNAQAQDIIPGGSYPDRTDVLILESTLGADEEYERTTRSLEAVHLRDTLERVIGRGGVALIPVFVMGRAQETLALIDRFKRERAIPKDTPVYTAGSMRAVADLYDKTRTITPRIDPDFKVFDVQQKRLPRSPKAKKKILEGPAIIVVSSGMMFEPTISNAIARRIVENENDAILLVGYAKEDSPAGRLLEAAAQGKGTEVVLNAEVQGPQPVHCTVERFRLSGHSNRRDLLDIAKRLRPEHILLVHGDTEARAWMAEHLREQHPDAQIHLPAWGEPIEV